MADANDEHVEINPLESATAAVGSLLQASCEPTATPTTQNKEYFTPDFKHQENISEKSSMSSVAPTPESWAVFFQNMMAGLQNSNQKPTSNIAESRKLKASEIYLPPFDPDDCRFTAAQWIEEIEHHKRNNSWSDYEARNAVFTHLQGRAKKWAARSYPLCRTWEELKERITRQFATTKRFHDLFREMVEYKSDQAASYIEYSTNKLALIDRLETGWGESNKIEVVISGITDNQVMVFTRPSSLPYPSVYHRFTVERDGVSTNFRVQDLTPDMREPALVLLKTYFTRDEPPCKYIGVNKHPSAVKELEKLWTDTMKDNLSLVCLEDQDEGSIVGVNVMTVVCKEQKDEPFHTDDKIWAKLFGAVDLVSRAVDIFSHYSVDRYLTAFGLVVDPRWRGMSIGKEMLLARIPFCKALNIKVTATVFTAAASQVVAKKAGFQELYEISYEELAKRGFRFPGVEQDTKTSKLMALVVE